MNTYDLEETKHQALLKFEELPEPIKPTLWSKFKTWMKAN